MNPQPSPNRTEASSLSPVSNVRFATFGWVTVGLFAVAALSQAKLQLLEQGKTIALAEKTNRFTTERRDYARRGAILGEDGKPLAQDERTTELAIQFDKVPHSDAFFMDVSNATGIPASEFAALAANQVKSKSWLVPLSEAQSEAVNRVRDSWRADGLSVARSGRREYPLGDAAACFVGILRTFAPQKGSTEPWVVRTGLEGSQDDILKGVSGMKVGLTDRTGAFLPTREEGSRTKPKQDGRDITLTIDSELQRQAYESVAKAVQKNKATNGVALVMDPKTGDILAMANYPSFDPTEGADNSDQNYQGYNPSYMAVLEPGSTFKILTLAKALDAGKVTMEDHINCHGELAIGRRSRIRCDSHHGNRAHGVLDPVTAIAKSCNVSAATWARKVGYNDFVDFLDGIGLFDRTNLGLPGEQHGRYNKDEPAKDLQLATIGFGQSVTCTPVGLIGAFGMLANQGVRVEPRLIRAIDHKELPPDKGKTVVKPEVAAEVMRCMEAVMEDEHGTGKGLRIPGYRLAGKTGTAQKIGRGEHGYVSNFVGFLPAEDPKAVILVMINDPKGGAYYGASVAGPVFLDVAKAAIRELHIPPTRAKAPSLPTTVVASIPGGPTD